MTVMRAEEIREYLKWRKMNRSSISRIKGSTKLPRSSGLVSCILHATECKDTLAQNRLPYNPETRSIVDTLVQAFPYVKSWRANGRMVTRITSQKDGTSY